MISINLDLNEIIAYQITSLLFVYTIRCALQSIGVYVENLSEFVVRSPSEVLNLLTVGKKRLVFAETKMNRNSSRFEILLYN